MSLSAPLLFGRRPPGVTAAGLWWSADALAAALFAGGLAAWLAGVADGQRVPWALAVLAVAGTARGLVQWRAAIAGQYAARRAKQAVRARLYAPLLATGARRGRLPGEDLKIAVDAVETGEAYVARFLPLKLASVAGPLLCAALMALASPVSAGILLATLLPFIFALVLAGSAARSAADRQFLALTRLGGLLVDRAQALPTILAFGAEERVTRQIAATSRDVADRTLKVLAIGLLSSAVIEFFAALAVALVAVYCGFSLLGILPFPAPEQLDLGRAFFVLALAPEFHAGMRRLAAAYHDKQQGEAAAGAILPDLEQAERLLPKAGAAPSMPVRLAVSGLVVRHPDGGLVGPVSMAWPALGLHVISGPSGSGKTSLLAAIASMASIAEGAMLADDARIDPGALASLIGWAGQRPFLLPGTLAENLLLAAPAGVDWQGVAENLGLGALLAARGGDLAIDPAGSGLSGGERRRIGLARAILSGRAILVLDEPTADLDAATAGQVRALLNQLAHDRLLIVATHDDELAALAASNLVLA